MTIDFTIKYWNRKTIGLCVERDSSIFVYCPFWLSIEKINDFVERKKFWIYKKLKERDEIKEKKEKKYYSGSSLMYLGKNYQVDFIDSDIEWIKYANKIFISNQNRDNADKIINNWYKEKAKEKIISRVKKYASEMWVSYWEIKLTEAKYRWWSCTSKHNLNFNWKLIKTPQFVIDYVIVHELAHTLEFNHSDRFWNIVMLNCTHYKKAKEWLKENEKIIL